MKFKDYIIENLKNDEDLSNYRLDDVVVGTYVIDKDGTVDVDGDVILSKKGANWTMETLPYKFGKVTGYFDCSDSQLTSLKNSPDEVGKDYSCMFLDLKDLKGSPRIVGGNFYCNMCNLTSLKYGPDIVGADYHIFGNHLRSLEGLETVINGELIGTQQFSITPGQPGFMFTEKELKQAREKARLKRHMGKDTDIEDIDFLAKL